MSNFSTATAVKITRIAHRADLAAARAARDEMRKVYEACQREVTRLRLAVAKLKKEERR